MVGPYRLGDPPVAGASDLDSMASPLWLLGTLIGVSPTSTPSTQTVAPSGWVITGIDFGRGAGGFGAGATFAGSAAGSSTVGVPAAAFSTAIGVGSVSYNWFTRVGSTLKDTVIDWEASIWKSGPMPTQKVVLFHETTSYVQTVTYDAAAGYPSPVAPSESGGYAPESSPSVQQNDTLPAAP